MAGLVTAAVVAITIILAAQPVLSGQLVEYLPGYNGKLPFKLETGYITVGDSEMFYYFIESQGNPNKDPLFLWLTGGPGCSSFSGILYEIAAAANHSLYTPRSMIAADLRICDHPSCDRQILLECDNLSVSSCRSTSNWMERIKSP